MAKTPFVRVIIEKTGKSISNTVESLSYEDAAEEDNMLTLAIHPDFAIDVTDDPDIYTDTVLRVTFGFLGGKQSETHIVRVTNFEHIYRSTISFKIKALDTGMIMRRTTKTKIWENKTSVQILAEIASLYGMKTEYDSTSKVWDNMPQGNKSDFALLDYLAKREEGGYIFYIRNSTMYFKKRSISSNSTRIFRYGNPDSAIISFAPSYQETATDGGGNKSEVSGVDSLTGKATDESTDNATETATGTLGDNKLTYSYDSAGNEVATFVKKTVLTKTEDSTESKNLSDSMKKKDSLDTMTAKMSIEGDPNIKPNTVITIEGVAKLHTGNWFVKKVSHSVSSAKYITNLALARNGTKTKGDKATDANKTKGNKVETVKVFTYDGNGTEVKE